MTVLSRLALDSVRHMKRQLAAIDSKPQLQPKPRKLKEGSREYARREKELRDTYAITVVPCSHCGSPRHQSYICQYCEGE